MVHRKRQLRFLLLLAAIVLLLQSFAVWHEVEHPFHHAEVQCERFHAITQLPVLDCLQSITLTSQFQSFFAEVITFQLALPTLADAVYLIRAPPQLNLLV